DNSKVGSHTAIIPTTAVPQDLSALSDDEKLLYDLLVKSLLRIIYPKAATEQTKLEIDAGGNIFKASGSVIKNNGWYVVDAIPEKKKVLPIVELGDTLPGTYDVTKGETEPPKRYTETDLIAAMELAGQKLDSEEARTLMKLQKKGLGTDATRTAIIKGLFDKSFIMKKGKSIIPTDKGIFLIDTLKVCGIKSPALTGEWEMRLNEIAEGRTAYNDFVNDIESVTREWFACIRDSSGEKFVSESEKKMLCPFCKKPVFKGRYGFSCSGYKEGCKFQVNYEVLGKKITESQFLMLVTSGKTGIIKGFIGKSGNSFDAVLKINHEKKSIDFEFSGGKK
ncbi:MAG: topoisomerase C-terminal repeat-containing protein, partial [Oscillospiraceae bacterium]|nr:topoisomerase C-terminal repeat-containing protein [Oscillospiraceae bacterium]